MTKTRSKSFMLIIDIIFFGALWGLFETTVGHILHKISFVYSWSIMYPVACFFMYSVYKKTSNVSSVFFIGLICSSIKLLNLLSPIRVDKVINPAVSIIVESLAMVLVIYAVKHLFNDKKINLPSKAISIIFMNTIWRSFYIIYLLFFVPDWVRNISVINNKDSFVSFAFIQNIITCIIMILGYCLVKCIRKHFHNKFNKSSSSYQFKYSSVIQMTCAFALLSINIVLQFLL